MTSTIAAIHAGFRQLGIADDSDKRAIYARVTGKDRLTLMEDGEKQAVVSELRRLGFRGGARRPDGRAKLSGKFVKKLQALWIAAWNLGIVRDRDDAAMVAFVRRQTGIDHARFLHRADDARAVVEALKAWMAREAGFAWDRAPQDWLAADGARIAWVQWKMLTPGADLIVRKGFDAEVCRLIDISDFPLFALTASHWQVVMNDFGRRIRKLKAGRS